MSRPKSEQQAAGMSTLKRELLESLLREQGIELPRTQAIPRRETPDPPPLSFAQQRLWFLQQFDLQSAAYNIPRAVRLAGPLNVSALRRSLSEVVGRHEVLRTTFTTLDEQPVQIVHPAQPLGLPVLDLTDLPEADREAAIRTLFTEESSRPFDLATDSVLRAYLVRAGDEEHVIFFTVHHIASDGWSTGVLISELAALYEAFSHGRPSPLRELPVQYADYALWQRRRLQGEALEEHLAYWERQLRGAPVLKLPTDRPRPKVQSLRGSSYPVILPKSLADALNELSRREGTTLFMTLLAAFKVLLTRYSGQEDICVGTPIAGRQEVETQNLIGFFINSLVMRTDLSGDPSFRELLGRVREVAVGAYAHQEVPFEMLVERLQPERTLSYSPLFQVMFVLQNVPPMESAISGLTLSAPPTEVKTTKYDLTLDLFETSEGVRGGLEYNSDLFEEETIKRLVQHFRNLLEGIAGHSEARLSQLPLMGEAEQRQLLEGWNDTKRVYPNDLCLHTLFEAQVERTPEAIAVVYQQERVSYGELNARADELARRLRAVGVGAEVAVGLLAERSVELVVGLLGILKAGGAYVPLDPALPRERLAFMLSDCGARVILTPRNLLERLPPHVAQVVYLDDDWRTLAGESAEEPGRTIVPENLAYTIYTSGSTGRPKGAMNTHRAICNRLLWMQDAYRLDASDRVLQKTPFSFDVSVWEFFWPLMTGARLVLARPGGHQDSAYLARTIEAEQITTLHFVPSMLRVFLEEPNLGGCASVRRVICSGEALPFDLQERFFGRLDAELHNLYGPTEAAVDVTAWECRRASSRHLVPIGRPIANTQIYLLDRHHQPVPVGVDGELYIGGVCLARGYAGHSELTAERFIPHPYGDAPGGRLYRTGDLARYLPEGEIEYLGRIDNQVKLRGFRIELGEVEAALGEHEGVSECVVLVGLSESGEQRLEAYLVPDAAAGKRCTATELRAWLGKRLPEYMVPNVFVMLDELPLSSNGKLDRRALSRLSAGRAQAGVDSAYVAPRNPVEEVMANIWAEVLRVERVGVHDNFFDLGGHSLLATQVVSRLRRVLQVEVELRRLFEAPTVAELAQGVEALRGSGAGPKAPPVTRAERRGEGLPLSFAQQRLWFIDQLAPGTTAYNIPLSLRVRGRLDFAALEQTLNEIVSRHEVLRTTFVARNRRPVQVIAEAVPFRLHVADLSALPDEQREREVRRLAREEARRSFDLGRGPLMRARLLRLGSEEHVMLFTMHHIISDAWSMGVLVEEFAALYEVFAAGRPSPLAELQLQYADFAVWQREWMQGEVLDTYLDYWKRKLNGASLTFELKPAPHAADFRGGDQSFAFNHDLSDAVKRLSRREGVTLFMTLLAAFAVLLQRSAGRDDIVIGTDVANRNRVEVESLIGFFVNILVLRADLSGNPTFRELLARVRETTLEAYEHQDLPFDKLVEALKPERALGSTPLFQAKLVLQNTPPTQLELAGLVLTNLEVEPGGTEMSKFDLCLTVVDTVRGLEGALAYSTSLFDPETVAQLLRQFETLLGNIVANPEARLDELEIFSPAEREQLEAEKRRRREANIKRFKTTQPRAVGAARRQLVKTDFLDSDKPLPLVIEPNLRDIDFFDWVSNNRDLIESSLLKHGAALFRGFGLRAQADLEQFLKAFSLPLLKYVEPRAELKNTVHASTEYPSDQLIAPHHELTHLLSWPMKICFFCEQPASGGGETLLADVRNVLRRLSPGIVERFAEKGWMLVRNSTRQVLPAVARHPRTGDMVWFNHVAFWHESSLEPHVREEELAVRKESELPYNTYYGDGSPIEESVVEEIRAAYRQETAAVTWRTGDLLVLDNMLAAHGRNSYTGTQKLLTAMGEAETRNDNGHEQRESLG